MRKRKYSLIACLFLLLGGFPSIGQQKAAMITEEKDRLFWYPTKVSPLPRTHLDLKLYPNPAKDFVQITIVNGLETSKSEKIGLEVLNSSGIAMVKQNWNGERLDVSSYPTGIYVVTLRKNKIIYSQKLAITRE